MNPLSAIILIILAIALLATNPTKHELSTYIKENIITEAREEGGFLGAVQELFSGTQSFFMSLEVERHNFLFFSTYDVSGIDKDRKYLGIFGTFIELH